MRRKLYDENYFRRWYHDQRTRIVTPAERQRRVAMVVAVAEHLAGRQIRSVLDIGCGEARWQPVLARLRPRASYLGVDSSEYAVRRFGRTRGIILGDFSSLASVIPDKSYDLVICADVMHYLAKSDLESGVAALAERVAGAAYLDYFTADDAVEGDMRNMQLRPASYYSRLFAQHGLQAHGMQFYTPRDA